MCDIYLLFFFFLRLRRPPTSTLFPYTTLFRSIGGLANKMPIWSFFMVFFVLASVGLPGLNGFVSEFMCLIGTFIASPDAVQPGVLGPAYAMIAALGMVVAAMYLLIMVGKIVFGKLKEPDHGGEHSSLPTDLSAREIGVLVPLTFGTASCEGVLVSLVAAA